MARSASSSSPALYAGMVYSYRAVSRPVTAASAFSAHTFRDSTPPSAAV